jgi:hypothetical protein
MDGVQVEVPKCAFVEKGGSLDDYDDDDFTSAFDFGYCLTVHKSQGSEWNKVLLIDENHKHERRRWLYTGVSDRTECVDLFSRLLPRATVEKLSAEQIAERMQSLFVEREAREYNMTAQVDLVIGQLTGALYQQHATLFGKRKRGSNAPTISEFLETHTGKSASWCRRCFKAYSIVTADDWDSWDCTGSIEGIIKAAADPNKPRIERVSKVQQRLDVLTDMVRRKEWEYAERMVIDWDASLP